MSAFSRALLAAGGPPDDVRFQAKVVAIEPREAKWAVVLESGEVLQSRSVLLTAPVPQALGLLQESRLELSEESARATEPLSYSSCLTVVAELEQPLPSKIPAILKSPSPELSGIYAQKAKGLTIEGEVLVIHASAERSRTLWDREPEQAMTEVLEDAKNVLGALGAALEVKGTSLHRWRYCEPLALHPESCLALHLKRPHPPLLLAGDAFGRASVEGAFASGAAAADALLRLISRS